MLAQLQPLPFDKAHPHDAAGVNLSGIFEQSPLAMWVFDAETLAILEVNDAALQQCRLTREEFLGMKADKLCSASGGFDQILAELRRGTTTTKSVQDWQVVTRSGAALRVDLIWHLIEFRGRRGVHTTMVDRTEQYDAQEENRELAEVLNLASDAIIVCNLERDILFWNQGATKIYGWSAEEAHGRKVHELFHIDGETMLSCMGGLLEKGEWHKEMQHARKEGPPASVNSRWTLARDEKTNQPKCVLLINSDITEAKKFESQFLRAQRLDSLGTLASGIAHDLNNILSPILMATGILRQSQLGGEEAKMLGIIEGSAERGAGIVKQVLTFARGAEGERVPLQPKHIINEMAKVMVQTFPKNLDIQTQIPRDLWMITGDATQIHQVLLNLCVNARDAIGEKGGTVRVSCENVEVDEHLAAMNPGAQLGPHVCIGVADTGSGMTPEVMEKIFDPFFTTKEEGKGTGLGLATVIGIVKGHKGFITIQSEVGVGTTFRVFLPATGEKAAGGQNATEPSELCGNGETLLVVDDEATIREAIVTTLQANGYECYTAEDGTDALALYFERKDKIAAVITDLHMGVMDGIGLVRSLRRLFADVKVIVSSGHVSEEKRAVLEGLGVTVILEKPYTAEKLLRGVKELLAPAHVIGG